MAGKIAVVRLRGTIGVRGEIAQTLAMLSLKRRYSMAIVDARPEIIGMVKKAQDYVAWGEISDELADAVSKKGRKTRTGFMLGMKSPAGGLRGIKQGGQKGSLGYQGEKITEIVKRMM